MASKWRVVTMFVLLLTLAAACSEPARASRTTTLRPPNTARANVGTPPSSTTPATTAPKEEPSASTVPFSTEWRPSLSHPCGVTTKAPGYRHVVWIIMENRGYSDVVGSPSAPYLADLAQQCGLATNYSGVAHPSLPNYVALTSGSTYGIADDDGPGSHPLPGPNLFSMLGSGWRSLDREHAHALRPRQRGRLRGQTQPSGLLHEPRCVMCRPGHPPAPRLIFARRSP